MRLVSISSPGIVALFALLSGVAGCGEAAIDQVPVYPVQGKLLAGGKPMAGAMLTLHPVQAAAGTSLRSMATVDSDGGFSFSTYTSGDGAPAGEFVLTAYWPDERRAPKDIDGESEQLAPDLLGGKFSNPARSPLRVHVDSKPNQLAPLDLHDRSINQQAEIVLTKQSP